MVQSYSQKHSISNALQHEGAAPLAANASPNHMDMTDFNALLSEVAWTRNRNAFVVLFDHFAPRVKGYLMQGGFPEEEAEEIAQETMLQVWQKAEYFDPERASASTWIYTIARNKKIDRLRKHKPIMLDMDYLMETGQDQDMSAGISQDIFLNQGQLTERLTDAIQELPKDQAELVRKAFFEDMSHTDIATKMQLPLGTVKSRLRAGLARLRKTLHSPDNNVL